MAAKIKKLEEDNLREAAQVIKKLAKRYFHDFLLGEKKGSRLEILTDFVKGQTRADPDAKLLENFLFHDPPLHIRRTLDQFHYYMTDDTTVRDSDQVITRYFQRKFPMKPVPIVMVDQLWLWIVNNSKLVANSFHLKGGKLIERYFLETIVTCFPQRWGRQSLTNEADELLNMTNVIDSMTTYLKKKARDPITSVDTLSEMIIAQCLGLNLNSIEGHHERYRYLEIFEHSIKFMVLYILPALDCTGSSML